MNKVAYRNPFRPGAGHFPPYLAGRENEISEFHSLLSQDVILKNLILTGLRGVGKTVLLDAIKPLALQDEWLWVGADFTESASLTEENFATRILTDLSTLTSTIEVSKQQIKKIGFNTPTKIISEHLNYQALVAFYNNTPGLAIDKLKKVFELVWAVLRPFQIKGVVFAYDEAQNLSDQAKSGNYPLSTLLDTFQSIQKMEIPFLLVLTGLPTLFPKLIEARTYAERMFRVVFLNRLEDIPTALAIEKPLKASKGVISFDQDIVEKIVQLSGGYPYFVQFLAKEVFDVYFQCQTIGSTFDFPEKEIIRKLDVDFYWGRYTKATDRQKQLLHALAKIDAKNGEFSFQEVVEITKTEMPKSPSSSQLTSMLNNLIEMALLYKHTRGRYSFAIPMMKDFLLRQI